MHQLQEQNLNVLLTSIFDTIQDEVTNLAVKSQDDYVYAFWLSNTYELLSIASSIPKAKSKDMKIAMDHVLKNLKDLQLELYYGWIDDIKKRIKVMTVPAVLENQSLAGYKVKEDTSLWGSISSMIPTGYQYTIHQLLDFLTPISKTMKAYYMEESIQRQLFTELIRFVGVTAFNQLLSRKSLCNEKRGII